MNYIGSKKTLLPKIKKIIFDKVGNGKGKIFCDIFAGTGIVAEEMSLYFDKVIANDLEYYAYVLLKHYLELNERKYPDFDYIDNLVPAKGLIYNHYAKHRMYFTEENAKRIDAARIYIERFKEDQKMYFYLLASLLKSADKVANTASVYAAYLKHYKETAKKKFVMHPAHYIIGIAKAEVYNEDANELIKRIQGDVLYLDPPYNERQYAANYHVLNTIAKYEDFVSKGVTGLPENWNRSAYSSKRFAKIAMEELLNNANFKHIFLSYNNQGILSLDDIKDLTDHLGQVELFEFDYKPFKSRDITEKHLDTKEYVIYLQKP